MYNNNTRKSCTHLFHLKTSRTRNLEKQKEIGKRKAMKIKIHIKNASFFPVVKNI